MVTAIRYYLVDSENVNDNWLMLFDMIDETDEIIVFYTKNSPHMSYPSVIKLLEINRTIKFEECFEGNNALDFQLISYMGYLMKNSDIENSEFIVMLNQASTDRLELAKLLNISELQMGYITNVGAGQGLLKVGSSLVPFINKFPTNTKLYKLMTTKPGEGN